MLVEMGLLFAIIADFFFFERPVVDLFCQLLSDNKVIVSVSEQIR